MKKIFIILGLFLMLQGCFRDKGDSELTIIKSKEFKSYYIIDAGHSVAIDTFGNVWYLEHDNLFGGDITKRVLIK
jgi:serine protease inhibitor